MEARRPLFTGGEELHTILNRCDQGMGPWMTFRSVPRTAIRELDELIRRMQSVIERESTDLLALPRTRLRQKMQLRVRSMRSHLRRLRNHRNSMTKSRSVPRP